MEFDLAAQALPFAMLFAGLFGLLSFLSPCVLPVVPAYLAYMSGLSIGDMREGKGSRKLLVSAIFFVMGLSTVFLILALTANRLASAFFQYQDIWIKASGLVIIIFGLHFLGVIRIGFLQRELRADANTQDNSPLSAYILGLAFAFGWSPCLGPALSTILTMVASQEELGRGMILMTVYAIGLGVPFILAAIFIERFTKHASTLNRYLPIIEKAMGILLIIVGVLMITGSFTQIAFWLNETFPFLERLG